MTHSKTTFLKTLAFLGLFYSAVGVTLHALFRLDVLAHHCDALLLGPNEMHLTIYTMIAALTATLFTILRRKRKRRIRL